MGYYLAMKKNIIIKLAGNLTELGKIPNEVTRAQKDKCHMFSFMCRPIFGFVCLA